MIIKYATTFILCIVSLTIVAQDTIKVQTFTWASKNRRDTFQFPDNSGETYRKILMTYNMRCHDGIVGNGQTGCKEWDYSCNTFITDPNRKDSTLQFHPNYVISGNTAKSFEYTTIPTFTYYLYQQHQTILSGSPTNYAAIENGTQMLALKSTGKTGKIQSIYTAAELLANGLTAGPVNRIQLNILQKGDGIEFLKIRLKHTNKTAFNIQSPDNTGFTEVYFSNTNFSNVGWQVLNFYQPFEWNGVDNILVEYSYSTPDTGTPVVLQANDNAENLTLLNYSQDNALNFSGASNVTLPVNNLSSISNEVTISFWCNGNASVLPAQSTLLEGVDSKGARQVNLHLPWDNSNVYWDCGGVGGGYDRINKEAGPEDFEGIWNYWAFTKNALTGNMKIYLNGKLWHSGTGLKKAMDIANLKFGSAFSGSPAYYGSIDELQIWNKELDEMTIGDLMFTKVTPSHPNYSSLQYHYSMNEGQGNTLSSELPNAVEASVNLPVWKNLKGADLYKDFSLFSDRFNIKFEGGSFTTQDQLVEVIDSVINAPNRVIHYGVNNSDLVSLDTSYVYKAGAQYVYDESGAIVDSVIFNAEGTIQIIDLEHYRKQLSKFELLSLVTPYGNNLNLSPKGKTFTFDVTDFEPILKGKKLLSIEYGGENQEELDIKFLFIKGTPPAKVLNIQNIWPEGRGYFDQIQNERVFEPRNLKLSELGNSFKLRSAVTGHGQNGEFVPREHYLDINGGIQDFTYNVWKYCAKNPIFPQGGTWIFDRAGWCPGAPTDVQEFFLDDIASPGSSIILDYGVNGPDMTEANYLVSNQLVTYGDFNFQTDAAIENIIRPNNKSVEFERLNPACNTPTILVKNTGAQIINSLEIEYWIQGGTNSL